MLDWYQNAMRTASDRPVLIFAKWIAFVVSTSVGGWRIGPPGFIYALCHDSAFARHFSRNSPLLISMSTPTRCPAPPLPPLELPRLGLGLRKLLTRLLQPLGHVSHPLHLHHQTLQPARTQFVKTPANLSSTKTTCFISTGGRWCQRTIRCEIPTSSDAWLRHPPLVEFRQRLLPT